MPEPGRPDVFISYSSENTPWAEKLESDLLGRGLSVFRDRTRLIPGANWRTQLDEDLKKSAHLLIVWTEAARQSEWVQHEIALFDDLIDTKPDSVHRMIFLRLGGMSKPKAYSQYQSLDDLQDVGTNQADLTAINPNLWDQVISKIENAVDSVDPVLKVPLLVLSMTRQDLDKIDPASCHPSGISFDEALAGFGVRSKADLAGYYGQNRADWQPFGGHENVLKVMNDVRGEILHRHPDLQFKWELLGEELWQQHGMSLRPLTSRIANDLSVVVIDPLALFDHTVEFRFNRLQKALGNNKAVMLVLPPFAMPSPNERLRNLVETIATELFESSYEPQLYMGRSYAQCSVLTGDTRDIRRMLLTTLGQHVQPKAQRSSNAYLRVQS